MLEALLHVLKSLLTLHLDSLACRKNLVEHLAALVLDLLPLLGNFLASRERWRLLAEL